MIECLFCGFGYEDVDALKKHSANCEKHPAVQARDKAYKRTTEISEQLGYQTHMVESLKQCIARTEARYQTERWLREQSQDCVQEVCPVTGDQFFCWLEHPDYGYMPMYGTPPLVHCLPQTITDSEGSRWFHTYKYDYLSDEWSSRLNMNVQAVPVEKLDEMRGELLSLRQHKEDAKDRFQRESAYHTELLTQLAEQQKERQRLLQQNESLTNSIQIAQSERTQWRQYAAYIKAHMREALAGKGPYEPPMDFNVFVARTDWSGVLSQDQRDALHRDQHGEPEAQGGACENEGTDAKKA